jgi:hypothetical protein
MTDYAKGLRVMVTAVLEDAPPSGLTSKQIAQQLGWFNRAGQPHVARAAGLLTGMHLKGLVEKLTDERNINLKWRLRKND